MFAYPTHVAVRLRHGWGTDIAMVQAKSQPQVLRLASLAQDDRSKLEGAGALFYGNGDLLDDFEAEAFEGGNVHRGVGQQADALDAKVGKDLATESDGAENSTGAGL